MQRSITNTISNNSSISTISSQTWNLTGMWARHFDKVFPKLAKWMNRWEQSRKYSGMLNSILPVFRLLKQTFQFYTLPLHPGALVKHDCSAACSAESIWGQDMVFSPYYPVEKQHLPVCVYSFTYYSTKCTACRCRIFHCGNVHNIKFIILTIFQWTALLH